MGVIKRESIKNSIAIYIGVLIGAVNVLFIYPYALAPNELGLIRFLLDTATLLIPFLLLGSNALAIRFFPDFKDEQNGHHGFLFFLLKIPLLSFSLFLITVYLFKDSIIILYEDKDAMITQNLFVIIPLSFVMVYSSIWVNYLMNFFRIAAPTNFSLILKTALPALSLLYFKNYISLNGLVWGILASHLCFCILLMMYTKWIGQLFLKPQKKRFTKARLKEMFIYAFYSIIGNIGSIIAFRIDTFMVATLKGLTSTGIYSIALFIATVIDTPRTSINKTASALIAQAWKDNNRELINNLYKKTALNQVIFGLFILLGIWVSIDDLFLMMPKGEIYQQGKYVVLILGSAKLIDMVTGINDQIISYSKYFRFNFYAILALAIFNIIFNLIFIPYFGINGAALATFTSLALFNFLKLFFIWYKLNMHPFSINIIKAFSIAIITYLIVILLPSTGTILLDIIVKSITVSIVFGSLIIYFTVSKDINDLLYQIYQRFV